MLSAGSTVNQLCRPPKNIFCMTQTCPGKAIFSENQQLLLIETVDLQERVTPLLTGSRDAPDNKSGSLSAGGGGRKAHHTSHSNGDQPSDTVLMHTSLPPLSPSGILEHAFFLIHLPLQPQLAAEKVFQDAARRDTTPFSG